LTYSLRIAGSGSVERSRNMMGHVRSKARGGGLLFLLGFCLLPLRAPASLPAELQRAMAELQQRTEETRRRVTSFFKDFDALNLEVIDLELLENLLQDGPGRLKDDLIPRLTALGEGLDRFAELRIRCQPERESGAWTLEEKHTVVSFQVMAIFTKIKVRKSLTKIDSRDLRAAVAQRASGEEQRRALREELLALRGSVDGWLRKVGAVRGPWGRIGEQILSGMGPRAGRTAMEWIRNALMETMESFEVQLVSLNSGPLEEMVNLLLQEGENPVMSLWQGMDRLEDAFCLWVLKVEQEKDRHPEGRELLAFLRERTRSLMEGANALLQKMDSPEAREVATASGPSGQRNLHTARLKINTLEIATGNLYSQMTDFLERRPGPAPEPQRAEAGSPDPVFHEGPDTFPHASLPGPALIIPGGEGSPPPTVRIERPVPRLMYPIMSPPPAMDLPELPGAAPAGLPLSPEERETVVDFEAVNGFALARLLHDLLGNDAGTLSRAALPGNRVAPSPDFWRLVQKQLRLVYREVLTSDPVLSRDPLLPEMLLGEVNYAHYPVNGGSFISLLFQTAPEGGAAEGVRFRPFAVEGAARWIPLRHQRRLRQMFIAYNDRFCGPANLERLRSAAFWLYKICAGLYRHDPAQVACLVEHYMFSHISYCCTRIPAERQLEFYVEMTRRGVPSRDHSREFSPQILAIFNLSQGLRNLCEFLESNPHPDLLERAMAPDGGGAQAEELRMKVKDYEMFLGEVITYLTHLDNVLHPMTHPRS